MNDIIEIKNQASQLRKQKSYLEAIPLYKELWENHQDHCNEWDGWGYAYCLRNTGQSDHALQIAEQTYKRWPNFDNNCSLLGWCIYDLEIKKSTEEIKQNESNYFAAVNRILTITKQDQYSPYARTIFKVIEYLEESRVNYPADYILTWLEKLNPELLSTNTWQGKDNKGRTIEHASEKEKWYTEKCKALFELRRYKDCIEFGENTLSLFDKFHYRNDKWIKRRIALSYEALEAPEKAAEWTEQILDSKAEWFIHFDMARFQFRLGNPAESLKFASEAALNRQGLEFKWKLFQMMAVLLKEMGEIDLAKQHALLAIKILIENEWKVPQELHDLLREMGLDADINMSSPQIEKQLMEYWRSLKLADLPKNTGFIKNIVSSGRSGFIGGDDRKDYYFRVDSFEGKRNALAPGLRVEFYIIENEAPGKLDSAIHIRELIE